MVPYAFELSERVGQMVIIRLTTRVCHGRGNVTLGPLPDRPESLRTVGEWDRMTCVAYQHEPMLQKLDAIRREFGDSAFNHYEGPDVSKDLIIAGGTGRLYAREAIDRLHVGDRVGLMSLGTLWPLPEDYILERLKTAERVLIIACRVKVLSGGTFSSPCFEVLNPIEQ